jgi:hypothetical protein
MKRFLTICTLVSLAITGVSCGRKDTNACQGWNNSREYSVVELSQDFEQFRRIMERKTAGLYTDRARLTELLDDAQANLSESMTELEFYRLLAPVTAELRCGHSFLSVSECTEQYMRRRAYFFPLKVRIFDHRLFVVDDRHGTGVIAGSEILRINGFPAAEVIRTITENMSTDGWDTGRPRYDAERWFAAMYFSYIDDSKRFVLDVRLPGKSEVMEVRLSGVRDPSLAKTAQGVMHDTANTPWSAEFHNSYALLQIPTFSMSKPKTFAGFLQDFFSEIEAREIDKLILDLRGNYGGTPAPTAELFTYLIDEPLPFFARDNPFYLNRWKKPLEPTAKAFGGKLVVLMDEACFSMNSFLLSLLKYHRIGTLVGTASSGGYMCSDASRNATLANTGLRLRFSTRVFNAAVEGQKPGIGVQPDVRIGWTLNDYLEGNDPVMAAALSFTEF